jgi:HEAT repeat protein
MGQQIGRSTTTRLAELLRIRPGEGAVAGRVLAMMVVLWSGTALGANAVESLFFVRFGPEFLPYLYIALGFATLLVTAVAGALLGRARGAIAAVPLVLAVVVVGMRLAYLAPDRWIYPALWLVMMIVWTVSVVTVWGVSAAVHDTRQAKRLFPLYGAGWIVGTIVGGLGTGPLAALLGPENLLILWAAGLVGAFLLSRSLLRGVRAPARGRPRAGLMERARAGARTVAASSLLRWMAVSLALFALLYFSLVFLFAQAATERYPDAARLAGFLGLFMGLSSSAALLASLLLAGQLFSRFGVAAMIVVLPVIYLAGFAVLGVAQVFAAVVVVRFVQMLWVNGVWAPGWQALFNVVPPERREQVRTFMDGVPLQAGVVGSGVVLVLAQRALPPRAVAVIGLVAAAGAVGAMWRAHRAYGGAVVDALRSGNPEVFVAEEEPFGGFRPDAAAVAVAVRGASDPDRGVRRISVEILAELRVPEGMDALRAAVRDEDAAVRAAAVRGLMAAGVALPSPGTVLADPDPDVRVAAVDAVAGTPSLGENGEALDRLLHDPDLRVRARAAVALLPASAEVVDQLLAAPDVELRAHTVVALGGARLEPARVAGAVRDPDPLVRRAAAEALSRFDPIPLWEELIPLLGDHDARVREAAVETVAAVGEPALPALVDAVSDGRLSEGALLALGRIPGRDEAGLRHGAAAFIDGALRDGAALRTMEPPGDDRTALLHHALRHRSRRRALVALRAVSGLGDGGAIRLAIENLDSRDPTQRANALEALEAMGDPSVVRPLVELWDRGTDRGTAAEGALVELVGDEDPWIRACAAHAAAGRGGEELRAALARIVAGDEDRLVREVAARALAAGEVEAIETLSSLSLMERVVFLRKVPLFAELSPADLKHVGEAATEHVHVAGDVLARQGEPGDEMFIVVNGEVRVMVGEGGDAREVARRTVGDYVGEMALIEGEPRMASLVCATEVRTLNLDRPRFERILRERPEASLALIRVLCDRLREPYRPAAAGA